jgi:hypothetical protein
VVELRGLELVAKHAVYANRSPGRTNSKGSGSGRNYVGVTAADVGAIPAAPGREPGGGLLANRACPARDDLVNVFGGALFFCLPEPQRLNHRLSYRDVSRMFGLVSGAPLWQRDAWLFLTGSR